MKQELITVPKQIFSSIVSDFEKLLEDFEMLVDVNTNIDTRIKDIKKGKVKGLTEDDFKDFLKNAGIKN